MSKPCFKAWIPTLSGRLSFSVAGSSSFGKPLYLNSDINNGKNHFVTATEWSNSDATFPFITSTRKSRVRFERLILRNSPVHYFLMHFKVDKERENLSGTILILNELQWDEVRGKDQVPKDLFNKLEEIWKDEDSRDSELDKIFKEMKIDEKIDFSLKRNGELTLEIAYISKVVKASLKDSEECPNLAIATFAYNYLRELFHSHKYHSNDSDTVISVYASNKNWKKQILTALHRKIISLRKDGRYQDLVNARGIIFYTKSFMRKFDQEEIFSIEALQEGVENEIEVAKSSDSTPFLKGLGNGLIILSAVLVTGVGYLKLVYDTQIAIYTPAIKDLPGIDVCALRANLDLKIYMSNLYLRFTDDVIIGAFVLILIGLVAKYYDKRLFIPLRNYFRPAANDIIRLSLRNKKVANRLLIIATIIFLIVGGYFLIQALKLL